MTYEGLALSRRVFLDTESTVLDLTTEIELELS